MAEKSAKVDALLAKFVQKERDHIDVRPVYLGFVKELCNLRKSVTSGSLNKEIERMMKALPPAKLSTHMLGDFFEIRDGCILPKMVKCASGKLEKMYDVDHVVPMCWGGVDHPRNFVVMHRSMNRALQDAMPEEKLAYISARNSGVLRQVKLFINDMQRSETVKRGYAAYFATEMK